MLSDTEKQRAEKYAFDDDRNRFVIGRGALRHLLGSICELPPHLVALTYTKKGKPVLDLPMSYSQTAIQNQNDIFECQRVKSLDFSITHSGQLIGVAISPEPVGLDVEQIREVDHLESIATDVFSKREFDVFSSLPNNRQSTEFFRLWTKKEAILKASGEGLTGSLQEIDLGLIPSHASEQQSTESRSHNWEIRNIDLGTDYAGSVAFTGVYDTRIYRVRDFFLERRNR